MTDLAASTTPGAAHTSPPPPPQALSAPCPSTHASLVLSATTPALDASATLAPVLPDTATFAVSSTGTPAARGRPRMHGPGRKANRALRQPVTYAHKLAVINFYDAHARDINATMNEFYAHLAPPAVASRKRQIYKWVKERTAIEEMCFKQSTAGHSRRREKGTATTLGTQGEAELVLWIQAIQRAGKDAGVGEVTSQTVKTKAMEIAAKYGVPAGSFQATWSWQQGFIKRHQDAITRF